MSREDNPTKNGSGRKTEPTTKRGNVHTIIFAILTKHGGSATPAQIETEGQKVKKQTKGRYEKVATEEYENKDGKVLPKPSQKGLDIAVKFAAKTGSHPIVKKFPKEAAEAAQKLGVKLP